MKAWRLEMKVLPEARKFAVSSVRSGGYLRYGRIDSQKIVSTTKDKTMNHAHIHQEYSARYGLKNALDDVAVAQQIAEEKYRALVGREIFISEITDIHHLIEELRRWVAITSTSTKSECAH